MSGGGRGDAGGRDGGGKMIETHRGDTYGSHWLASFTIRENPGNEASH